MSVEGHVKALLIAVSDDAPAAVYSINRLKPEMLCFFVAESAKSLVETNVQPQIAQMPRRWDWVVTPDAHRFMACYQALSRTLPDLLRTWEVNPGELVVDLTGTTPAMAAGLTDQCWSVHELLSYRVPPPPWTPPKRRGRPSRVLKRLIEQWCGDHG